MSHQDDLAAAPRSRRRHATKRRARGGRRLLAGAGVVGLGLLAAVLSGAFRPGQTGGAPAGDDGRPGMPSLIQADPSGDDGSGTSGTSAPSSTSAPRSASASPSTSVQANASATATTRPTATDDASSDGSVDGATSDRPGKSGSAPGQSKRPK
ncbi:hypothetical protein ABZ946_06375 [Streptomyces sp. NPDC046324]|uniref:hypothetical protein n=1 Tax=Streptomyces sp. NPDC046324 TaxID=3154915 RepID=UPI0033C1FFD8